MERLVQFVKDNFLAGRTFTTITELNYQAWKWCDLQNGRYHKCVDCIPHIRHIDECRKVAVPLVDGGCLREYLCPLRVISFDGFVSYEGMRFGVPYWYTKKLCRIKRREFTLNIYSDDFTRKLVSHGVTWNGKDSFCEGQYANEQPVKLPTVPVRVSITQNVRDVRGGAFERFDFGREVV